MALKLANDPDRFLSTVQIGITLIGILTGIYSGNKIASDFTGVLTSWGVPASYADTLAQGIIVVIGTEDGEVQPVEQDIMERVFLLGDLKVSSIMTHKNDIVWLDTDMTADDVKKVLSEKLYEFYPIADGDLDHVKGIVNLKDLVLHLYEPDFKLTSLIHEAAAVH